MKKRQLFIGAFAVVLALTMSLSLYTRVKAEDPDPSYWCTVEGAINPDHRYRPQTDVASDCTVCENDGAAFTYTDGDVTYWQQNRHTVNNTVFTHGCEYVNFWSVCTPVIVNPGYQVGDCNNIIEVLNTGTGN